jgi:hypothetical protein
MGYCYRALENGTLGNPYRFIKKGDVFETEEPIKAKWLVLEKDYVAAKPLPITPYLSKEGHKIKPVVAQASSLKPPAIKDANYDAQMKDIKRLERVIDGKPTGDKEVI